jgi:hypothetical protein
MQLQQTKQGALLIYWPVLLEALSIFVSKSIDEYSVV